MTLLSASPAERTVAVAVPRPMRGAYHYRVPEDACDLLARGSVVLVPFGPNRLVGYVVALDSPPPVGIQLRLIAEVLEPGEAIPPDLLTLAEQVADYYLASLGEILRLSHPSAIRITRGAVVTEEGLSALAGDDLGRADRAVLEAVVAAGSGSKRKALGFGPAKRGRLRALAGRGLATLAEDAKTLARPRFERWVELVPDVPPERVSELIGRKPRALRVLERLGRESGPLVLAELRRATAAPAKLIHQLEELGLIRCSEVELARDQRHWGASTQRLSSMALTAPQQAAVRAVVDRLDGGFAPFLLHGVTGSGKTLVYLECIAEVLARGRGALLLVPEIALTPVLSRELRGRFGDAVAVLHSELAAGERYDAWRRVRAGQARVVFGVRSAVFAPVRNLGIIIVDEEHDPSYKQAKRPSYHARDVAVLRAKIGACAVVLGSATPALESYAHATSGRYTLLELGERTAGQTLPEVEIVDLREEFEREGANVILSARLIEELERRLGTGEQAMLLLNRRGYASFLLCRECGGRVDCPNCSVSLVVHKARGRLRCHRCDHSQRLPQACPACKGSFLHLVGYGTEKVEAALRERLPQARVGRLDRDAVQGRNQLEAVLESFGRGEIDILVGTQMIAKGHDFGGVTLVGVVSVDAMLALPDFRATERAFALLTQAAGRAGRGDRSGRVILQTYYPDNQAVKLACEQDYASFYAREMRLRRLMRYPPTSYLANLVVRGAERPQVEAVAGELARALRAAREPGVVVLGPASAPVERMRGEHRLQILLKSARRKGLRAVLDAAREQLEALLLRQELDLDVDPQDLL